MKLKETTTEDAGFLECLILITFYCFFVIWNISWNELINYFEERTFTFVYHAMLYV